jgi:hypothetical protein
VRRAKTAVMKKITLIVVLLTLAAIACKEQPKKIATHAAAVVFVVGSDAKIFTAKGEVKAVKGAILHETDKVQTGKKSQVDVLLPNNILIRIDQNTTVEMKEFGLGEGGIQSDRLMLQKGTVFAKVAKLDKKSAFAIQTPTIVAGVRGTQFMTEADDNGQGKVAVIEGKVAVESAKTGKTEEVAQGEQVQVNETGSLVESKIDEATAAKTNALSLVSNIKAQDLQNFQNILGDQQKLLDKASGSEKLKGMMDDSDKRIQDQKDQTKEKVEGLKGQTDTKIQDMKASTEGKVQQSTEKVDSMKNDTQNKIDSMKGGGAVEDAKKKQEEMFKKFP